MKGNLNIKRMLVLMLVWVSFLLLQVIKASEITIFSFLNLQQSIFIVEPNDNLYNIFVGIQNDTTACSTWYWVLNLLQVRDVEE